MATYNASNERVKRKYFTYLREAARLSEQSVDAAAKSIARFEGYTRYRDFKTFRIEQAVAFKKHLSETISETTGALLSKSTLHSTLAQVKRFFQWLSWQPGYKSRLSSYDADYFNLSARDTRIATARRQKVFPTVEQVKYVIDKMPFETEIEQRNRAVIAFIFLTGARDGAVASFKLKHLDLVADCVNHDARDVKSKFGKTFPTYFFPVGPEIRQIVADWVTYLKEIRLWGNDDPLFPATNVVRGPERTFIVDGIKREHWGSANRIREIFRDAFQAAGLSYFNPHSIRNTLSHLAQAMCKGPREFKAWCQNLGHENVLTTFNSYGTVADEDQREIIRALAKSRSAVNADVDELADAVARKISENLRLDRDGEAG